MAVMKGVTAGRNGRERRSRMAAMMRITALLISCALVPAMALAQSAEDDKAVRATINQYFKGHATADPAEMRKAFLPTAHVEGVRDDKLFSRTVEVYASGFGGKPANDEATRKRTIDSVDIAGTAAMVRATLVHGATTFTDYFVLLKTDAEWKIANKVYSSRPTR
jgi:hypothetical protein